MSKFILQFLALLLLTTLAQAAPILDQWNGSTSYATLQGNRVITVLAVSADGMTVFAGTGSGTAFVFPYSDTAAPILTDVGVSGTGQTATILSATSNEVATGYWIVIARNATAPTTAEVKAGLPYAGVSIVASGSGVMTAALVKSFAVTGLTAATPYDLYVAAQDTSSNLSGSPILVAFATPADPAPEPAPGLSDDPWLARNAKPGHGRRRTIPLHRQQRQQPGHASGLPRHRSAAKPASSGAGCGQ